MKILFIIHQLLFLIVLSLPIPLFEGFLDRLTISMSKIGTRAAMKSIGTTNRITNVALENAFKDPVAVKDLTREIGLAIATARKENPKATKMLLNSMTKAFVGDVFTAAKSNAVSSIKSTTTATLSSMHDLAQSLSKMSIDTMYKLMGKPIVSTIDEAEHAVVAAVEPVVSTSLVKVDQAVQKGLLQKTKQSIVDGFKKARELLEKLSMKITSLYDQAVVKSTVAIATKGPEQTKRFGLSVQTIAKTLAEHPEKASPLAENLGHVMAKQFLEHPAAGARLTLYMMEGSAPVVAEQFMESLSWFVGLIKGICRLAPSKAMKEAETEAIILQKEMARAISTKQSVVSKIKPPPSMVPFSNPQAVDQVLENETKETAGMIRKALDEWRALGASILKLGSSGKASGRHVDTAGATNQVMKLHGLTLN